MNNISKTKSVSLRCTDNAEMAVLTRWEYGALGEVDYELNIEDAYCGGDYMGIKGRFKRAWHAFWAKPVYYTGIYCEDKERMRKFLTDCLELIDSE